MDELLSASQALGSTVFSTKPLVTSSDTHNIGFHLCLLEKLACFWPSADSTPPPPQQKKKIILFKKLFQEYMYHQCQKVWVQIRRNILSGLTVDQ